MTNELNMVDSSTTEERGRAMDYPKNVEELECSEYKAKALVTIMGAHLDEDAEDTWQDILVRMHRSSYLERFDPEKGLSFSTYFYGLIKNHLASKVVHKYNKSVAKVDGGPRLDKAIGKEDGREITLKDVIVENELDTAYTNVLIDDILDTLSAPEFAGRSENFYIGSESDGFGEEYKEKVYKRDLRTTFELLAKGLGASDIARLFGTSASFVSSLVMKLREIPQVKGLLAA